MISKANIPTRRQMLDALSAEPEFDVVVIGGGATGLGVAVDAASRGLRVALFEKNDFASGTSSKSTKLIHGGVRYLANPRNWGLIREALVERRTLLTNAPELVHPRQFVVPCYSRLKAFWYGAGLSLYSMFSGGGRGMGPVRYVDALGAVALLPGLQRKKLKGALCYSDAQFDDAGLAVALYQTAVGYGAEVLNYMPVEEMLTDGRKVTGCVARDSETGERYTVRARAYINCAGVWVDTIRRMVDVEVGSLVRVSRGSHVVVDGSFLPTENAMVVPKTTDGRVLFCIPWQGRTLIGTTDIEQGQAPFDPQPSSEEIDFMIENANRYLTRRIRRGDVRASFAGLRPLFAARKAGLNEGTAKLSRGYAVVPEFKNLLTVAGGKWTSYRAMAESALATAQQLELLQRSGCRTRSLPLVMENRAEAMALQQALLKSLVIDQELGARLLAFVRLAATRMGARTAQDVLHRRLRLGQLDAVRTQALMPVVEEMLARVLEKKA